MFAVETKYLGPTYTKGARIVAKGNDKRVTVPYPYDKSGEEVHRVALAEFLKVGHSGWLTPDEENPDNWVVGSTADGYAFVYAGSK